MASRDDDNAQVRRRVLRSRSIQNNPIFCVDDPHLATISSSSCKGLVPYRGNATLCIYHHHHHPNVNTLAVDPSSFIFLVLIAAAQEPDTFNPYDNLGWPHDLESSKKKIASILQLREEDRDSTDFVAAMQEEGVADNFTDWGQQQEGGGDDNAGGGEAAEGGGGDAGDGGGGGGGGDGDGDIQHPMIGEYDAKCDFCRRMFGAWTCAPWCGRLQICRTCRRREALQPNAFCHICNADLNNQLEHTIHLLDNGLESITVTCHPPQPLHEPPVPAYLAPPIPAHQEPHGDWQLVFHHTIDENPYFVALTYYIYEQPDVPGVQRWYVYETHER